METKSLLNRISWAPVKLAQKPLKFKKILFVVANCKGNKQLPDYRHQLEAEGYTCVVVEDATQIGSCFEQETIVVYLPPEAKTLNNIFETATKACNSLIRTAQVLQKLSQEEHASFKLFSIIPYDTGVDGLGFAPLHGLARVLQLEVPNIFWGLIENDSPTFPTVALQFVQGVDYVKVVKGVPQSAAFQPFPSDLIPPAQTKVRSDASYLITGGTRGVGLEMATWMGAQGAGNIILVSRNSQVLAHGEKDPDSLATRIANIESLGSKVHVVNVDVSKEDAADRLARAIEQLQIPSVKGVIHAAGIATYNTLNNCPESEMSSVLAPKIIGSLALDTVFPPGTLDFLILTSSVGQLVGFPGQLAYAPANSFLDQFASYRRSQSDNTISIQWTCWRGVGMLAQNRSATRMITKGMTVRGFIDEDKSELLQTLGTIISSVQVSDIAVLRALELEVDEPVRHPVLEHITPRKRATLGRNMEYPEGAIAVVGMSCRSAAGETAEDLWQTISTGKTMAQEMDLERFPDAKGHDGKMFGNFMEHVDAFDHQFFKKSKREATALDPHQRVLLEAVYHALEAYGEFGGGKDRESEGHGSDAQVTGCFVGMSAPDYALNLACHPASPYTGFGMLRSFVSGRLSHHFGWTGPSHVIDTACSSAMTAIHQACRAIQVGECTRAVAAGVNLITNTALHHALRVGGFLSPDGPCKTFDAAANGYCRGESVGVIILKPLRSAMQDGDNIMGVLLATGNNQNINSTSITNPVFESQSALYRDVLSRAGVNPSRVSYVEAHGTGTRVGDPVEVQSLRHALGGRNRKSKLYMGAVKANVGHSEGASGIISLIKVLLMLRHGKITPQANFKTLNPNIAPLELDMMEIPTALRDWTDERRIALVNSYGASGNNAAAVLAPAPVAQVSTAISSVVPANHWPIFISAGSNTSLLHYCAALKTHIEGSSPESGLALQLAFALASKQNRRLPYIFSVTASSLNILKAQLSDASKYATIVPKPKPIVLLFSGQNSSTIDSARALYDSSLLFRAHVTRCDEVIRSLGLPSITPMILEGVQEDSDLVIRHATLFVIQYSCGMAWIGSGVKPQAICGHSFGEWAALVVSGALTLRAGLQLIIGRASIIQTRWGEDKGLMCAIEDDFTKNQISPEQYLEPFLTNHPAVNLNIACFNGPDNYVVAGSTPAVNLLESWLIEKKRTTLSLRFKVLRSMHAYHSAMADPIIEESAKLSASITFQEPSFPFESCHKDSWTGPGDNVVARNTRGPVYFAKALARITGRLGSCIFLEAGVGGPIIAMARRASTHETHQHNFVAVSQKDAIRSLAEATAALWRSGQSEVQFWPFHNSQRYTYTPVELPQYQFERVRHWVEYAPFSSRAVEKNPLLPTASAALQDVKLGDAVHTSIPYIVMEKPEGQNIFRHVFRINPQSERFQNLVSGHLVVGSPICPAGMYLELATHAVTMLPEVERMYAIPEIACDYMENKAPLGLDEMRRVQLFLEEKDETSWSFEFRSTKTSASLTHSVGRISMLDKNAQIDEEEKEKWNRILRLTEDPDAEALRGTMIYKIFKTMCQYSESYKGLRYLVAKGIEGVGDVFMSRTAMDLIAGTSSNGSIIDACTMDNFFQVPGIFVHSLRRAANANDDGSVSYVCTGMGAVRPLNCFQGSGKYRAYARIVSENEKQVSVDVFAFDKETTRVIWSCRNATFSKISRSSLAKALAVANPDIDFKATSAVLQPSPVQSATIKNDIEKAPSFKPVPAPKVPKKTIDTFGGVRDVLSRTLDVPAQTITREAALEDIGLDSLVSSEVLSQISEKFRVNLSTGELSEATNVASLCETIASKRQGNATELTRRISKETDSPTKKRVNGETGTNVLVGIKEMLSRALSMPPNAINEEADLMDLGIDSLVAPEILSGISDLFNVEISMSVLAAMKDVRSLCHTISARACGGAALANGEEDEKADLIGDADDELTGCTMENLIEVLGQCLLLPIEEIHPHSRLDDLGVDSLVSVEIVSRLNEISKTKFSTDILLSAGNVRDLYKLVGDNRAAADMPSSAAFGSTSTGHTSGMATPSFTTRTETESINAPTRNGGTSIHEAFQSVRRNFDGHAKAANLMGYLETVYPQHLDVVVAFILEAFESLGCSIKSFKTGEKLPALIETLPMYQKEISRLWNILEQAGIAVKEAKHHVRGQMPIKSDILAKPASYLSKDLLSNHHAFMSAHALSHRLGPHLASCLVGKTDPISVLFGHEQGRSEVADFHANGPGIQACHEVLCDFFRAVLQSRGPEDEALRVLEVGAGTGGTTRHLIPLLQDIGVPFQYTFTDLSGSLLTRAKNSTFFGIPEMDFRKLDIEKEPPTELLARYHIVVSSNCVHATRDLNRSLSNIRKLLRPQDGCLALVELTQKLAWYDIVWGLLEGWWLFEDGRSYALQSPWDWKNFMLNAGFAYVDWSESQSPESRAVRVICAMTKQADNGVAVRANSIAIHDGELSPTHQNLFLLPDGFGSGAVFQGLAPALRNVRNVSVYGLTSPFIRKNHDMDNPPSTEELAAFYVTEIKRRQPKGPYMLGGYSFGGIVAYEATRHLMEDGEDVTKIFFIDVACPRFGNSLPEPLVNFLDKIHRDLPNKVGQSLPINSPHFNLARRQLASYRWSRLPGGKCPEIVLFSGRSGSDKQNAIARPKMQPSEQEITDWFLDDRPDGPLGWDELLGVDVRVYQVNGNHFSMMMSPDVDTWSPKLAQLLE